MCLKLIPAILLLSSVSAFASPSPSPSTSSSLDRKLHRKESVLEGQDVELGCDAKGDGDRPETMRWVKSLADGQQEAVTLADSSESGANSVTSIRDNGSLYFRSASGPRVTYTCIGTNNRTSSVELTVVTRTVIEVPPKDTRVVLGSTADFPCSVRHDKSVLVNHFWFFNDKNITPTNRVQLQADGGLRLEQVRNTDVGSYKCLVISGAGNDSREARLGLLELPHAPTLVKAELDVVGGLVNISWWPPPFDGNSAIVKYVVEQRVVSGGGQRVDDLRHDLSLPDAPSEWSWSSAATISSSQNFVLLSNLRPAMTYQFRVKAVNTVGEGQPSLPTGPPITLPAQPPSAPPTALVGAARSSTAIIIQWHPPPADAHNGKISGYIVRYKLAGYADSKWYQRNVTNPAQLSYLLDDLIVWQNYEIQIGAYNEMGIGSYSQSIFIRTREGMPGSPPLEVEVEAINSTALKISWKPPDPQLINGINLGYKVRALLESNELAKEVVINPHIVPSKRLETILSEMEPFTSYVVRILCFTSAGDGPPSKPIVVTTLQDLPGQVAVFRLHDILDTSARVEWAAPENVNGELLSYTLKYFTVSEERKVANYSEETRGTVIMGLKPETTYTFEINAWTMIGPGPSRSATVKTSVPPVLPKPPTSLALSNIGAFSVVIQFTPGFNGNSSITRWIVEGQLFRLKNASWRLIDELVSNPLNQTNAIAVGNLRPYTEYRLRVYPVNIVGKSLNPSDPSPAFQTLQSSPAHPPLNITVRPLTPTSLRVLWSPLSTESWNGHPKGYNVTWREFDEGTDYAVTSEMNGSASLKWHVSADYLHSYLISGLDNYTNYAVQIFAINDVGTSSGSHIVLQRTPSHMELRALSTALARLPFFRESWFVILCASFSGIFTLMVFAILCVQSKSYKYKRDVKKGNGNGSQNALTEGGPFHPHHPHHPHNSYHPDNPYASAFELQRPHSVAGASHRRSNGTLNTAHAVAAAKSPPRPAPGSLTYDSDEEDMDYDTKEGMLYESSGESLTEKPSEMSSSGPESEDFDQEEMSAANHFVNHYANVNDTLRKGQPSWKKQGHPYMVRPAEIPIPHRTAPPIPGQSRTGPGSIPPSYSSAMAVTASEESELDMECPSVNLNGGRLIVLNMAGSRAPMQGFSSFV